MHKFFVAFLIVFALAGVIYRLSVPIEKVKPVNLLTYTDEELGITLQYPEGENIRVDSPILIPIGSTALATMVEATIMDGSGLHPEPSTFAKEISPYTTIYYVKSGQFEGLVSYDGYVTKNNFIVPIRYHWDGVTNWTDPSYDSTKDPHFKIFLDTLKSVQFTNTNPGEYEGLH